MSAHDKVRLIFSDFRCGVELARPFRFSNGICAPHKYRHSVGVELTLHDTRVFGAYRDTSPENDRQLLVYLSTGGWSTRLTAAWMSTAASGFWQREMRAYLCPRRGIRIYPAVPSSEDPPSFPFICPGGADDIAGVEVWVSR